MFALAKDRANCVNYDNWWLEQPASNSSNVSMSTSNQVPSINGCGIETTYIFFMVYILLTFFLLINLFIGN